MAEATGQPVDGIVPADALTWFLESLPNEKFNEMVTELQGDIDPDAPYLTGDPVTDEWERQAAEKRKAIRAGR